MICMKVRIIRDIGPIGCVTGPSVGTYIEEKEITTEELLFLLNNPEDLIKIEILYKEK